MTSASRVTSRPNYRGTKQRPYAHTVGSASGMASCVRAAVDAEFDVFLTNDSSVEFQQNVKRIGIAVAIVGVRNRIDDLRPLIPEILEHLAIIQPGQVVTITG